MSKLILVHSGESEWDRFGKLAGLNDVPLSEKGHREALQVGFYLADIPLPIHLTYTSPLQRSVETAKHILSLQEFAPELFQTTALTERNYGAFTGQRKADISKKLGESAFKRMQLAWDDPIENVETIKTIHDRRVEPFHRSVARPLLQEGENVLAVTFHDPLRAYVKLLDNIPEAEVANIDLDKKELRIYDFDDQGEVIGHISHVIRTQR